MTEEARCAMLAKRHDKYARELLVEAESINNIEMASQLANASRYIQGLAIMYMQAAETLRKAEQASKRGKRA